MRNRSTEVALLALAVVFFAVGLWGAVARQSWGSFADWIVAAATTLYVYYTFQLLRSSVTASSVAQLEYSIKMRSAALSLKSTIERSYTSSAIFLATIDTLDDPASVVPILNAGRQYVGMVVFDERKFAEAVDLGRYFKDFPSDDFEALEPALRNAQSILERSTRTSLTSDDMPNIRAEIARLVGVLNEAVPVLRSSLEAAEREVHRFEDSSSVALS